MQSPSHNDVTVSPDGSSTATVMLPDHISEDLVIHSTLSKSADLMSHSMYPIKTLILFTFGNPEPGKIMTIGNNFRWKSVGRFSSLPEIVRSCPPNMEPCL